MTSLATKYNWVLVDKEGTIIHNGIKLKARNGKEYELTGGRPPMHDASTGHVWVKLIGAKEGAREFYPNVFDLKWEIV